MHSVDGLRSLNPDLPAAPGPPGTFRCEKTPAEKPRPPSHAYRSPLLDFGSTPFFLLDFFLLELPGIFF